MKKDCVMFLTAGLGPGGAEKNTVTIANALSRQDEVIVVSIYPDGVNASLLDDAVTLKQAGKHRIIAGLGFLIKQIREYQPTCIICNKDDVSLLAVIAKFISLNNTRVIARVAGRHIYHDKAPGLQRTIKRWRYKFLYKCAYRIVAVSGSLGDELIDIYGIKRDKVIVIYNPPGVTGKYNNETPETRINNAYKLVSIGRLTPLKNLFLFIDIINEMPDSHTSEGFIVGSGPMKNELEAYAQSIGVLDKIHFVGYLDDPVSYLKKADLYLLTSYFEGLPGSLIHALVSGVKIVSADCRHGPHEILDGGKFGTLIQGHAVTEYVNGVVKALDMEESGNEHELKEHLEKFSLKNITRQWRSLAEVH